MAFTLFDASFVGTRGTRVRWMLEESGATFDVRELDLRKGEHRSPEHLERHPHGLVPAAEVGGLRLIESAAMCMHLADTHPDAGLAPALGTLERAQWYQWITYAVATLDAPLVGAILNAQLLPPERRRADEVERGKKVWDVAAPFLERSLAGRAWLLGERFSAADVVLGYDVVLAGRLGWIAPGSALAGYLERLTARPAFKKAYVA